MLVRATKAGYYGGLREPGAEFPIKDEKDLGSWMVKAERAAPAVKPGRKPRADEQENLPDA